jgi:hypothetical protein
MPQVIIPVGLSLGPQFRYVRPPDPRPECYEIQLGGDLIELDETEAAVWAAAFVDAERHSRLAVNRKSLLKFIGTSPNPEPRAETIVSDLLQRGLLAEFDPRGSLEAFFSRHRMLPLGEGLGSTAEDPHLHRIGHLGRAAVAVTSTTYTQWSFSHLHPNLWAACAFLADDTEHVAAGGEPLGMTSASVAREVAENLPMMIATSCAFLTPVVDS